MPLLLLPMPVQPQGRGAAGFCRLETRAHLAESADLLDAMLKASVTKS